MLALIALTGDEGLDMSHIFLLLQGASLFLDYAS